MRFLLFTFINFVFLINVLAQDKSDSSVVFSNIKDVLKNDMLEETANQKQKEIEAKEKAKQALEKAKFNIPENNVFWGVISELWLIKNINKLKWDFKKPDYGIEDVIKKLLEKNNFFEKKFKLLYLDSPTIFHAAIPGNSGEIIFLLSVPFIKTLDLSKLEIALLLFEDYLRLDSGYLIKKISDDKVKQIIGSNFHQSSFDDKLIDSVITKLDEVFTKTGFSFQEQYEVTNRINVILKSNLNDWSVYYKLLEKIDQLVKSNVLFRDYLLIYPSPELQLGWLRPKK